MANDYKQRMKSENNPNYRCARKDQRTANSAENHLKTRNKKFLTAQEGVTENQE